MPAGDGGQGMVRWVARLSCGHAAGSRGRVRVSSTPAIGAILVCSTCVPPGESKVEDVIDSRPLDDE
jgi:hypothetical protein